MITKKFLLRSNSNATSAPKSSAFLFRKKKSLSDAATVHANDNDPDALQHSTETDSVLLSPPPPLARRSISPSDLHYFSQTDGGCNAPLTPLSHHYSSNEALLALFHAAIREGNADSLVEDGTLALMDNVAYAIGVKYVEVALFTIPHHAYFETHEYRQDRKRAVMEAKRVVRLLEGLIREERQDDAIQRQEEGEVKVDEGGESHRKRETIHKLAAVAQQSYQRLIMESEKINKHGAHNSEAHCSSWKEYVLDGADHLCSLLTFLDCGHLGNVDTKDEAVDHDDSQPYERKNGNERSSSYREKEDNLYQKRVEADPTLTSSQDTSEISHSKHTDARLSNTQSDDTDSFASRNVSRKNNALSMKKSISNHSQTKCNSKELQTVDSCGSIMTEKFDPNITPNEATPNRTVEILPAGGKAMRQDSEGFDRNEIALAMSLSRLDCELATVENTKYKCTKPIHYGNNISSQTKLCKQKFHSLVQSEKIHVRFLDTYQGRIRGSTNGCTVIAPLTCIQYFITPESNHHPSHAWNHGLPDENIHQVIDVHAPTILENVRSKLNLAPDSFIIPSDVHDHLLHVGLLSPTSFVGVCGGNILDEHHLMQLKHALLLSNDEGERMRLKGRKIASALFFHGHVVALHVIQNPAEEKVFVELIDSLPIPEAWVSPQGRQSSLNSCESSDCEEREPASDSSYLEDNVNGMGEEWERYDQFDFKTAEDELPMNAVRIRCTDMEHFDTLLRHYALSKFSREEQKFIDENPWEDNNSYFDPRVFQAFIWSEAE
ncbi:hypothetical protein ACHAWX_003763 [Stephanocyclus meneghinianus]